ncbi:hypothetical protein AX15_006975 [Amanita polypyramis BW_CC]|nr:hypothetical protein AX15_006975 [Amanita polypyramis BW_CC]
MRKHMKTCWGDDVLTAAGSTVNADEIRTKIVGGILRNGSITESFERKGNGKRTYSNRPLSHADIKAEIVCWVSVRLRPSEIVNDEEFNFLMKTASQLHTIQSRLTIVKAYEGHLSFTTDAWTSPNHWAYVAICIHFEAKGTPVSMILDIVEVAESHMGANLAAAIVKVLNEFNISEKVLSITCDNASANDKMVDELELLLPEYPGRANHA